MEKSMTINSVVKESLTEALLKLIEKKSFHDITITELTKKAGVGRVSFYRNFKSKEDILITYFSKKMNEWSESLKQSSSKCIIMEVFRLFYENRDFIQILYKADLSYLLLKCLWASNGPKPEHSNHLAYWNAKLTGGLFAWCDEWIRRGMQETPEEMRALVPRIVENASPSGASNESLYEKIIEIEKLIMNI
jgi:AcrR family transcriptional regulator